MRREIRIGTEFDLNRVAVLSIAFSKSRGGKLAGCDEKIVIIMIDHGI